MGASAALALEWRDLELMAVLELENCLEFLGSFNMSHDIYMKLWERVDRVSTLLHINTFASYFFASFPACENKLI